MARANLTEKTELLASVLADVIDFIGTDFARRHPDDDEALGRLGSMLEVAEKVIEACNRQTMKQRPVAEGEPTTGDVALQPVACTPLEDFLNAQS